MSSLIRSIKNVTNGYTSSQVKVRNATSNEEYGPSTHEMSDIAQLTYQNQELFFIMDIIDKRLNDKGKNWRHVLKSLTLLDYLVHNGSDNVVIWCHTNLYVIKSLREFQYRDESGKDQGVAIRARAKDLTSLLQDTERLRSVRARAGSGRGRRGSRRVRTPPSRSRSRERISRPARYRSQGSQAAPEENDEELQKALKLSMETAEEDERRRQQLKSASSDDLNKAINLSQQNGLYSQQDWQAYQKAQAEFQAYQQQLALQQTMAQQQQQQLYEQQQQQALYQQQQQALYEQQQYEQQQALYQQQLQQQQQQQQYEQSQQQQEPLAPLQPLKTGSNNPFAMPYDSTPSQPTAFSQQSTPFSQQNTSYSQQNTSFSQQNAPFAASNQTGSLPFSSTQTQSTASPFAQPQNRQSTGKPSLSRQNTFNKDHMDQLDHLLNLEVQADSFGNTGSARLPQHHTGTTGVVNSAGVGYAALPSSSTGKGGFSKNPFQQQYTGIATTQMQPSHTGYGFGNANQQKDPDALIDL